MTQKNPALIRSRCGRDVYLVGSQEALEKVPSGSIWVTESEVKAMVPAVGELVLNIKEVFGSENVRVRHTGKHVEGYHYVQKGYAYELEKINARSRPFSPVRENDQGETAGEPGQQVYCDLSGGLNGRTESGGGISNGRDGKGISSDNG